MLIQNKIGVCTILMFFSSGMVVHKIWYDLITLGPSPSHIKCQVQDPGWGSGQFHVRSDWVRSGKKWGKLKAGSEKFKIQLSLKFW